jgi:tetrahydromethanopterin S-methyltransferase subunit G
MELDKLKTAWGKMSDKTEKTMLLNETEIQAMLEMRALDISQKIGRNIRIGIGIVLGWVLLNLFIDFILSPVIDDFVEKSYLTEKLLSWLFMAELFNYILVIVTILIFGFKYWRIETLNKGAHNLKSKLTLLIKTVDAYKTMFYVVLVVLLVFISLSFSSGFISGLNLVGISNGAGASNLSFGKWAIMAFSFLLTLGFFIVIYYLLFSLFFKRLYGKYLTQLKNTLKELNETNNTI